jgi:hypothetical protein
MPHAISPYLADEIARQRAQARQLLAVAPPDFRAALTQLLRDLDELPVIVAESFLLQALGTPSSRLRELERAVHRIRPDTAVRPGRRPSAA